MLNLSHGLKRFFKNPINKRYRGLRISPRTPRLQQCKWYELSTCEFTANLIRVRRFRRSDPTLVERGRIFLVLD